jgi:hypothetical protein
MAEKGLTVLNPMLTPEPATYTGSYVRASSVVREDSPDIPVAPSNSIQSENSVFVNPNDIQNILNSNNSGSNPGFSVYGANNRQSFDGGINWEGEIQGVNGSNSGDPAVAVGNNGWYYVGYIHDNSGQGVSYSADQGETWTNVQVATAPGFSGLLDKNHLWIDNSLSSPYEGHLYDAWTVFDDGINYGEIGFSRSVDGGISWSEQMLLSTDINAGSHNQGVNISTGPNGEVYCVWTIYEEWPSDETAMAMARSFDGGETWDPAFRIIENIRGIRSTETSKNMRVNSFPVMTVDISGGPNDGTLYMVWSNIGIPGINEDGNIDVYMIKSSDHGDSWSEPIKVNQDPAGQGKEHYFPWIASDPESGILSVIFYDDRNVSTFQCEVFCANSYDGGETWEDFKVSDVSFTPSPVPGLADGYMGDYLGITSRGGMVYPVWSDNRTGTLMSYVSPYLVNTLPRPTGLEASVEFETGNCSLSWTFYGGENFSHFNVYRDDVIVGTTVDTFYVDALPVYGVYKYTVRAEFDGGVESSESLAWVQWGDARISISPDSITETLQPDSSSTHFVTINNTGQLDLNYLVTMLAPSESSQRDPSYCDASGGCDEYISRVILGDIDHETACDQYGDHTDVSTVIMSGSTYELTVYNGNPVYSSDKCGVWIDWNQNGDFTDDEPVVVNGSPGFGPYTAMITPTADALPGTTRMRIRIDYNDDPLPCGITDFGEVEDYTINVLSWLMANPLEGTINPGSSEQVAVELNAAGLELGNYYAELSISSNDPDFNELIVPVSLLVDQVSVDFAGTPDTICGGTPTQIMTTVTGGSGSYNYNWSSIPEGFSSTEAQPVVDPIETTTYVLEVNDGSIGTESQYTLNVLDAPMVDLGPDTTVCEGDLVVLDAGTGHTSRVWSTGDVSQTITVSEQGLYWVEVNNDNNCLKRDSIYIDYVQNPEVYLGEDTVLCVYHTILLDAGNPGANYLWSTGETTQTIVVDTTGMTNEMKQVSVEVFYEGSCFDQDSITISFIKCLGIEENNLTEFSIFPNPNKGSFKLVFNASKRFRGEITIFNSLGMKLYSSEKEITAGLNQMTINLEGAEKGVHTLRIGVDNTYETMKFMVY